MISFFGKTPRPILEWPFSTVKMLRDTNMDKIYAHWCLYRIIILLDTQ